MRKWRGTGLAHETPVTEGKQLHGRHKEDVLVLRNGDPGIPVEDMCPTEGVQRQAGVVTATATEQNRKQRTI